MSYRLHFAYISIIIPVAAALALSPGARAASANPTTAFHLPGWFPVDITADPVKGVLVVERLGQISRVYNDESGFHQDVLFTIALPEIAQSITAGGDFAYVTANSRLGCTVYRFTFSTKIVSRKTLSPNAACDGIALAGSTIFVVFANTRQLKSWDTWDSEASRSLSLQQLHRPTFVVFDKIGQRLLVADSPTPLPVAMENPEATSVYQRPTIADCRIYSISFVNGNITTVSSGIGQRITSITSSASHIFFASGKRVSMIRRSDNHNEKTPPSLEALTGGQISGVAADAAGNLWYADENKGAVAGPLVVE